MGREERIRDARRKAAERAPEREAENRERAIRVHRNVSALGPAEAQRRVSHAEQTKAAGYLGPKKTPAKWHEAVQIAREVTIAAARRRRTITYGELKWAIFDELGLLVGWSMFRDLVAQTNEASDGVLISSIIVHQDDGRPGDGFLPFARSQGFDGTVESMQRDVWDWASRI